MKEIKFRAWDKEKEKMLPVVSLMDLGLAKVTNFKRAQLQWMNYLEWMQFTGLKDKNGKEIWEGDIMNTGMRRGDNKGWSKSYVIWGEISGNWLLADLKTDEKMQMQNDQELREIIGNIYENPELLEVK